jgi:hypothetical protein
MALLTDLNFQLYLLGFLFTTALFCLSHTSWFRRHLHHSRFYFLVVLALLCFYLGIAAMLRAEAGDVRLFSGAGYYLRHGVDFYWIDSGHTQYPFFPFLIYYHAFANYLSERLSLFTFSFYLKLLLLSCLFYLSYLIRRSRDRLAQIQFLTSPITFSVILIHGQVDIVLLAYYFTALVLLQTKPHLFRYLLAISAYTFSVAAKTWSIIFLPLILWQEKRWRYRFLWLGLLITLLLANIFVYVHSVFGSSLDIVWPALSKPGGPIGIWGISAFIKTYNLDFFGFSLLILLLIILRRCLTLANSSTLLVLGVMCVIPNWGVQYLFWLLPFLYWSHPQVNKFNFVTGYTLLSLPYLFVTYASMVAQTPLVSSALTTWLGLPIWLYLVYGLFKLRYNNQ